jgi:hypothetical protein
LAAYFIQRKPVKLQRRVIVPGAQLVEKVKYAALVLFAGGIFQRVAEFISATRFLKSRRSGDIFLPFIVEKARRSGFFDSLSAGIKSRRR